MYDSSPEPLSSRTSPSLHSTSQSFSDNTRSFSASRVRGDLPQQLPLILEYKVSLFFCHKGLSVVEEIDPSLAQIPGLNRHLLLGLDYYTDGVGREMLGNVFF